MGKRSDFKRLPKDQYLTVDPRPAAILAPHLRARGIQSFAEPCVGAGDLVSQIAEIGFACNFAADVEFSGHLKHIARYGSAVLHTARGVVYPTVRDALDLTPFDLEDCDAIITNPPWSRKLLHPMIHHFASLRPTWLLLDADWKHTVKAAPYMAYCRKIISVGRVKWFDDTAGKDNCAWYLFDKVHSIPPKHPTRLRSAVIETGSDQHVERSFAVIWGY